MIERVWKILAFAGAGLAVLAIVAVGFVIARGQVPSFLAAIVASRNAKTAKSIVSSGVLISGASPAGIDLAFEITGRVNKIDVAVGDTVAAGQPLMELDGSQLKAQLDQANAVVRIQKALLMQLQTPSSSGILAAQIKNDRAIAALDAAKADLVNAMQDAYVKAEDAVHGKADQLFLVSRAFSGNGVQFSLASGIDSQLQTNLISQRLIIEGLFPAWRIATANLNLSSDLVGYSVAVQNNVYTVKTFVDNVSELVNGVTSDPNYTAFNLRNWKLDLMAGRTNLDTALKNLWAAIGKFKEAKDDAALQAAQLDQLNAPPSQDQVQLQTGKIAEAEGKAEILQVQLQKTVLASPIAGVVSHVNGRVGMTILKPLTVITVK